MIGVLQMEHDLWEVEADTGATGAVKSQRQTGHVLLQLDEMSDS